jgi:hypothetical protein
MRVSSRDLGQALVERVGEVLPAAISLSLAQGGIAIYANGALLGVCEATTIVDEDDGRSLAERVHTAVLATLGSIQDFVMHHLTTPWPTDDRGELAFPGVRVEPSRVVAWYGASEKDAAVTIRPIALASLQGSS